MMLHNYLKIALRNFLKQKSYSVINILGLAIGIACCILILLHIQDELNFDRMHNKADQIYRVVEERTRSNGDNMKVAFTKAPLGPALVEDYPDVLQSVRFFSGWRLTVKKDESGIIVRDYHFTDPGFFKVFDYELLAGNAETALAEPQSVVITQSFAESLFGETAAIGQTLKIEAEDFEEFGEVDYRITGVMADIPSNSHLDFKFLISMPTLNRFEYVWESMSSWRSSFVSTYVLLDETASANSLLASFEAFSAKYMGEEEWAKRQFFLQPLTDIHFYSEDIRFEQNEREGQIFYVYVFSMIAIFIVLIACINYMNLATARSINRAREVGMRKVVGAARGQLIRQFLGESLLTTLFAAIVALVLVEAALPFFNDIADKNLNLNLSKNTTIFAALFILATILGVLAGMYPAFILSGFKPISVLSGSGSSKAYNKSRLRQFLVTLQFSLSSIMIVATLIIYSQLDYMQNKELGFDEDRLLLFDINHDGIQSNFGAVKEALLQQASIQQVTVSSRVPGDWKNFRRIGVKTPEAADEETSTMFFNGIDEDFLSTYQIELLAGRNFNRELASDSTALILNKTAASALFGNEALGKEIEVPSREFSGQIIGIVEDFHFHSLHEDISPMVMGFMPESGRHVIHGIDYFTMRIQGQDVTETIAAVRDIHNRFDPINPLEFAFLDDWLLNQYSEDSQVGQLFGVSAALAILVACIGLFGLATFSAEQRTKEIGVRKVLGATIANIVQLLYRDFSRPVLFGLIVAFPIVYWAMHSWLQQFAYRITIGFWPFLLGGAIALFIALATVSYQAIKAAIRNPVEALRYE